jgi:hypothetical protein
MPSPISFFPVDCPPATPGVAPTASNEAPVDASASFDSVLTKAAPASGKSASRPSVCGSARATSKTEKPKSSEESTVDSAIASDPSLLSAQELAAMLAMIGAPVALASPPPAVPVDFSLLGNAASQEAAAPNGENSAEFTAPLVITGKDRDIFLQHSSGAQEANTPAFVLHGDARGTTVNARDLLEQGAEVLDYELLANPDVSNPPAADAPAELPLIATVPAKASAGQAQSSSVEQATVSTFSAPGPSTSIAQSPVAKKDEPTPARSTENEILETVAIAGVEQTAGVSSNSLRFVAKKPAAKAPSEKIAAPGLNPAPAGPSGVNTSNVANKNNFLSVDSEELESDSSIVGTRAADWGISMNPESRSTPFTTRLPEGGATVAATFPGVTASDKTSETAATSAPQAAQIVSEIRDIADSLWAVERSSVEVRFHFNENEHLSVKVEYRDGVVKTTFRTDSPELRDTLAREWQSQVASSSDARPYRVADPVFNTPPADARGFSLGGDTARQQRQSEQASQSQNTFAATFGRGPSSSSSVSSPVAPSLVRPDTALHLHAFA